MVPRCYNSKILPNQILKTALDDGTFMECLVNMIEFFNYKKGTNLFSWLTLQNDH